MHARYLGVIGVNSIREGHGERRLRQVLVVSKNSIRTQQANSTYDLRVCGARFGRNQSDEIEGKSLARAGNIG